MAINTFAERASLISLGLWRGRLLPRPSELLPFTLNERLQLALVYPHEALIPQVFQAWYGAQINKVSGVLITPE